MQTFYILSVLAIVILLVAVIVLLIYQSKNKTLITQRTMLTRIEYLGNLELVKYRLEKVVEYKKIRNMLLPDANTVLIASGEIFCGIDFKKLTNTDIQIEECSKTIQLRLPSPRICHVKIDHENSKIYDMKYGFWDSAEIADEVYKFAEQRLYAQAQKLDLLTQGRNQAVLLLKPMLQAMGFEEVDITFKPDEPEDNNLPLDTSAIPSAQDQNLSPATSPALPPPSSATGGWLDKINPFPHKKEEHSN